MVALIEIQIPEGFRHHSTGCFAESWEAFDALTLQDGWAEHFMELDAQGRNIKFSKRMPVREHRTKRREIDGGGTITAYPPFTKRPS